HPAERGPERAALLSRSWPAFDGHSICDLLRERERAPSLRAGHDRRALRTDCVDEVGELALERLVALDRQLAALDWRHRTLALLEAPHLPSPPPRLS